MESHLKELNMQLLNTERIKVIHQEDDVNAFLSSLDVSTEEFTEILYRALSKRESVTSNFPAASKGHFFTGEAVSSSREILSLKGFKKLSIRNVEFVANDKIAIHITRGCEQTGLVNGYPETFYPKGEFTCDLMGLFENDMPGQGTLPTINDEQLTFDFPTTNIENISPLPNKLNLDLWFLMYTFTEPNSFGQQTIRAEFSRPLTFSYKNKINSFSIRVILSIPTDHPIEPVTISPEFTPDIDIDILNVG